MDLVDFDYNLDAKDLLRMEVIDSPYVDCIYHRQILQWEF